MEVLEILGSRDVAIVVGIFGLLALLVTWRKKR